MNSADIVFDWNEPIATNCWENITDNTAPESAVNGLPSVIETTDFEVSWTGSDEGSDIFAYTIYVSENDSAYYPWIIDTKETSAIFTGKPGYTYKFYSIAVDSAGNTEEVPATYDAMTTIDAAASVSEFDGGDQFKMMIYPNPAKESTTLKLYLPEPGRIRVDVLSLCGSMVLNEIKTSGNKGVNEIRLDLSKLQAGTWFIRTLTDYGVRVRKIVVK
jgi:hypothetical protein